MKNFNTISKNNFLYFLIIALLQIKMYLTSPFRGFSNLVISILRPTYINNIIKTFLFRVRGAKIKSNLFVHQGVFIDIPQNVKIGQNVVLSKDIIITAGGGVQIGDRVLIGYGSKILSTEHIIPENIDEPIRFSGHRYEQIIIENDVWIASNVVITAGVRIGSNSVIAAGAVVTKDVEANVIMGGVPARIIKRRG